MIAIVTCTVTDAHAATFRMTRCSSVMGGFLLEASLHTVPTTEVTRCAHSVQENLARAGTSTSATVDMARTASTCAVIVIDVSGVLGI